MPQGIVPELLIFAALIVLIGGIVVASRRPRRRDEGTSPTAVVTDESDVDLAEIVAPAPIEVEGRVPRPTLRDRLGKSRRFLTDRLSEALGRAPDENTWEDIEAALIQADVGVETATRIAQDLKDKAREHRATEPDEIKGLLVEELVSLFDRDLDRGLTFAPDGVTVWLVVGVNGTGKTTTIGKLAADLTGRGKKVSLAAADTFRAAADEQLAAWAERAGAELVRHQPGADPGAVAYDAQSHARARGVDVLIVDTAGRLHTKTPLMDELGKIRRVVEKEGRVQESLLVLDATAGQNGLVQAREFAEAAGVTGVIMTKLDGTAKGGIALAVEQTLGLPIKLVGVGEGIEDLEPFDPKTFVDALLA